MKVDVSSVASIDARRIIYQSEVAVLARALAGKKATLEIPDSSTVGDLVKLADEAFNFSPDLKIVRSYLVIHEEEIDNSRLVHSLPIKKGETIQIRYVVEVY